MKRAFLWLLCSIWLFACSKSDQHTAGNFELAGTWRLAETLADPGDGSGTWKPASAPLLLIFGADGSIQGDAFPQARRYQKLNDTNIRFTFADGAFINYTYSLTNTTLILSGSGCIEPCGLKFKKDTSQN